MLVDKEMKFQDGNAISSTYKGVKIFGFGSIIPMDLIRQNSSEAVPGSFSIETQNYTTSMIFNSNTISLNGTPNNEFETKPELINELDNVPRSKRGSLSPIIGQSLLYSNDEECSLDGSTKLPSSSEVRKTSMDLTDHNLISSIVMKAELARVALIGLDDSVYEDSSNSNSLFKMEE